MPSRRRRKTDRTKKLTKVPPEDTNNLVADSSIRSGDAAWDDLDQAFFASAPPDVPEAPAAPERFDDLFPEAAATPARRARATTPEDAVAQGRAAAAAAASRALLRRASGAIGRGARPAVASVGRVTSASCRAVGRSSARVIRAAGRVTSRTAQAAIPAAARLAGALRIGRLNGQTVAIVVASVILLSGLSAVVVASRGNGHANLPATPLEPRAGAGRATVAAVAPPPAAAPFAPAAEPAQMQSVLPDNPEPAAAEPEPPAPAAAPAPAASEASQESSEKHRHHAEAAKHPAAPAAPKHRRASYSAEKDLMLPSFMQGQPQASKPAQPQAAAAAPTPARQLAPATRPAPAAAPAYAPAPPARPLFSR
ncbi:MAG TPA: hypothetical protein VIF57_07235 [Polyangia bacterium]